MSATDMLAQTDKTEHDNETHADQMYGKTQRSLEFTSESNKMELINLTGRPKYHVIKNLLERQYKLNPHKIKVGQGRAFIAFKTEGERDKAIATMNNQEWKGKYLIAQIAAPRDDILAKRRKIEEKGLTDGNEIQDDDRSIPDDEIISTVCPLWGKEYAKQIEYKETLMRSVLCIGRQILQMNPKLRVDAPPLYDWVKKNEKICCTFEGVVGSPVTLGYRNKCEFNVGRDKTVGFKIGRYRSGSDRVCRPPSNCPIMPKIMFKILDVFQQFLNDRSKLTAYDHVTHEGHYRQLTVRCNTLDECLLIIDMHPQKLSIEELDVEIQLALESFKAIEKIVSIYFNIAEKCQFSGARQSLRLAFGLSYLHEYLAVDLDKPLKFRVGPVSFFQVNTKAAELLYRSIIDVAQLNSSSMVLDVGCGTGTIGLSLAKLVSHVIGIEIIESAIEDAKENARANGIENVSFYAGKAEDLISESLMILKKKLDYQKIDGEIVVIVDPPRVGFNSSFIKTLRASSIKKIVYIACDPKANPNLLALCRPKSKAYQGDPFVPVRAKAFDLFPHTKCCELVLVYERLAH